MSEATTEFTELATPTRLELPGGWQCRVHGDPRQPALVYLPGIHGDWTLITSFRAAIRERLRFAEFCYSRDPSADLPAHAEAMLKFLRTAGISQAWLLAESFGSQVAWAMLEALPRHPDLRFRGLILAGGFVRYPFRPGLWAATHFARRLPDGALRSLLGVYARVARARHRHAPETRDQIGEFVRRRLEPGDREAVVHRLRLIACFDPRRSAAESPLPVWSLTGLWDPIVPWPLTHPWMRRHLPGWRGHRILPLADHTVLATQPSAAARWVLERMGLERSSAQAPP